MSLIPAFEIGIWNAWIFMIWTIVIPILLNFIIKEKGVLKILRTSVPMKYEKSLNIKIQKLLHPLKLHLGFFHISLGQRF